MDRPVSRSTPFRRGRFEDLPALPRRPHPYFQTRVEQIDVSIPALGRIETHVRIHGSGPPLLLVHGLMTTSYSWRYVLEPLGKRYTLYVPDLPGAGRSGRANDRPFHPQALADWLGALQRELERLGAPIVWLDEGSHFAHVDAVEQFLQPVEAFLA